MSDPSRRPTFNESPPRSGRPAGYTTSRGSTTPRSSPAGTPVGAAGTGSMVPPRTSCGKVHTAGRLAGLWRPPFERTWSVPDQYATACSSPVSKGSSPSSIEQIISKEEAAALMSQQQPGSYAASLKKHPIVETPLRSSQVSVKSAANSGSRGKLFTSGDEHFKSFSPIVTSPEAKKSGDVNLPIFTPGSGDMSNHASRFNRFSRSESVEKKLKQRGSPPQQNYYSNGKPVLSSGSVNCNTLPNSPTGRKVFVPLFGRMRRFPSLKLQRHTPSAHHHGHHPLQTSAHLRKTIVRSTPTLQDGRGPVITVTTHSDEELIRNSRPGAPPGEYSSAVHLGDETSLYGTPKEQTSPPPRELSEHQLRVPGGPSSASNYLRDQIISFFQPSDNKLAMKLFGNKNALMKEKLRQKAAGNWVIHPCSNFRSVK